MLDVLVLSAVAHSYGEVMSIQSLVHSTIIPLFGLQRTVTWFILAPIAQPRPSVC